MCHILFWFKASMHGTVREPPLQWIISALELRGWDQQQVHCTRTYQRHWAQSRSPHCSCAFANQTLLHLPSERLYQRSALPSGEANHTFYILHSMWLCTIADTLMMVSHVWRSEDGMKSKVSHRNTSVFCSCRDKPLHCSSHQHLLWSSVSLNLLISVCQWPRFSVD